MIIKKGLYIRKFIILFFLSTMLFLTSFGYFLGWKVEFSTCVIYLLICLVEISVAGVALAISKAASKTSYKFDLDKNVYLIEKNSNQFVLSFAKISKVFYVRPFWSLLLQLGAGYLQIQFINNHNTTDHIYISMSLKDVKRIENMYQIHIEVR